MASRLLLRASEHVDEWLIDFRTFLIKFVFFFFLINTIFNFEPSLTSFEPSLKQQSDCRAGMMYADEWDF